MRRTLKDEDGYTLVETLVAMALFLSVLIPLGVAVGALLLDREAEHRTQALLIAEHVLADGGKDSTIASTGEKVEGSFLVKTEARELVFGRDLLVTVYHRTKPNRMLVRLHKTVLAAP